MPSIIHLMPESLANQIAAGEVVQRPASVVKELLENSLDAVSTTVELVIRDGGKSLIQVTDNGAGMSPEDARMCFERHATSKIRTVDDLFRLHTFGFRGEALASIAAVARVELRTRQAEDPMGTWIELEGGRVVRQEPVAALQGTRITVTELFFTVPARRNFLKGNPAETKHIVTELFRAAISRPDVGFRFSHNEELIYDWPAADLKGRLLQMHTQLKADELLSVQEDTKVIRIRGYVAAPNAVSKGRSEQYFVVNGRFVRDTRLHYAVINAYRELIGAEAQPFYALFLDLDPARVDVNIHPTKTEVKFEDEHAVYGLLQSVVRRALGSHMGSQTDDLERAMHSSIYGTQTDPTNGMTVREWREGGSPRDPHSGKARQYASPAPSAEAKAQGFGPVAPSSWKSLYGTPGEQAVHKALHEAGNIEQPCWQANKQYLFRSEVEGIRMVHRLHAWQRIVYEKLLRHATEQNMPSQQLLYPQTIVLGADSAMLLEEALPRLQEMGFNLRLLDKTTYLVSGLPADGRNLQVQAFFDEVLGLMHQGAEPSALRQHMARSLALHSTPPTGRLTSSEIHAFIEQLLACEQPAVSPSGKPTFMHWAYPDLEAEFCG
jgi:DNA mismatch repair protein MutL